MAYTNYSVQLIGGAANTKGAYVELVASTPYASSRLHLQLRSASNARRFFLIDIATGAVAAETVVLADVAVDCDVDAVTGNCVAIDVDVPAGTRLSARCQSVTAAAPFNLMVLLEDRALGSLTNPVTYGTTLASSRGTLFDCGAVANTKTAYTQFSASTSMRIDALALCATIGNQGGALSAFVVWTVDIATGAAAAETIVVPDLVCQGGASGDTARPGIVRLSVSIPAGTRIAVRAACSSTNASDRLISLTLIGMQEPAASGGGGSAAVAFVG